jgi:hypothetical protein
MVPASSADAWGRGKSASEPEPEAIYNIKLCNSVGTQVEVTVTRVGGQNTIVQPVPVAAPWPSAGGTKGKYHVSAGTPVVTLKLSLSSDTFVEIRNGPTQANPLVLAEVSECP